MPIACVLASAVAMSGCGSSDDEKTTSATVQITAPADGSSVGKDRVTVRGTVSPSDASVQIVGQTAQVGNGVFTGSVPLPRQEHDRRRSERARRRSGHHHHHRHAPFWFRVPTNDSVGTATAGRFA